MKASRKISRPPTTGRTIGISGTTASTPSGGGACSGRDSGVDMVSSWKVILGSPDFSGSLKQGIRDAGAADALAVIRASHVDLPESQGLAGAQHAGLHQRVLVRKRL